MKRLFCASAISLLLIISISSQENVLKINIFSPIIRTLNIAYERTVSPDLSLQISGFVGIDGYGGLVPELRYFPSDNNDAPEGFYLAPFLRYIGLGDFNIYGGGLIFGGQKIFGKVVIDTFI